MVKGKYIRTEEIRKKMSEAKRGHIPWNKGRIGKFHHTKETKQKISVAIRGEKHPFYGKPCSEIRRKKISIANKGRTLSLEHKRKFCGLNKGKTHPNWKGGKVKIICKVCGKERYVFPTLVKQGIAKYCSRRCLAINRCKNQKNYDTDIERLIENELICRNIPYTKQVPLLGLTLVDFLLPHDIVIYCDGSYWHLLPERKKRDLNQEFILTFYGYKVFRFTDKEIKKSLKKCIDKIIKNYE